LSNFVNGYSSELNLNYGIRWGNFFPFRKLFAVPCQHACLRLQVEVI